MDNSRTGLSLSGGGYRATAFHLGVLQKLHQLNKLSKIDVLSTISGGSIAGAAFVVSPGAGNMSQQEFENFKQETIQKLSSKNLIREAFITSPGSRFTLFLIVFLAAIIYFICEHHALDVFIIFSLFLVLLYFFQFSIFPVSKSIEKSYARYFTRKKTLKELPEKPMLVLSSTNLQTARPFVFSKKFMGDSSYTYAETPVYYIADNFPLARAVMASSCVPGAFSPVHIDTEYFTLPEQAANYNPILADGGVYDNQGIHKLMHAGRFACNIIITSDAGNKITPEKSLKNSMAVAMRTMNVFMTRIKNVQLATDVYQNTQFNNKEIAYLSLGWDCENCIPGFIRNLINGDVTNALIQYHQLKPEWVADPKMYETEITNHLVNEIGYNNMDLPTKEEVSIARKVGTNLTPLKKEEINALIKQAAALTEIQIKLYCPSL
jgi:NTE family protein